jgi:hypothetical protein
MIIEVKVLSTTSRAPLSCAIATSAGRPLTPSKGFLSDSQSSTRVRDVIMLAQVYEAGGDAETRQQVLQQRTGAAVDAATANDKGRAPGTTRGNRRMSCCRRVTQVGKHPD